ncbi:MAG: permease [Candidatus Eremiobacteraeota bacterium]|nr:permease [Candidatus Eremiobacteraeota bacterium]MBV8366575.1 permease [Candidatus Eremiobacteraeota bacterium]
MTHVVLAVTLPEIGSFLWRWLVAAFAMFWAVLWSLLLGFLVSAMIQAYVPKGGLSKLLGRVGLREIALATGLGAASSSCSYAAAATAKSLFKRGAAFTTAMVFMFASTNLVVELGLVLWRLMGWPFVAAEWIGGLVLIAVFVALAQLLLPKSAIEDGRAICQVSEAGGHEHDHGDMIAPGNTFWEKLRSPVGWRYVAHYFQMDWSMLQNDLILGFVIAGLLAIAVPNSWWQHLFVQNAAPGWRMLENALVGPIIAVLSFVCSIGNVPLAAVLWQGGATFGGVVAFLYADLIVLPLIDIYRKYYGWRLALSMTGVFYISMVIAGLLVELLFSWSRQIPHVAGNLLMDVEQFSLNYTTILNIIFVVAILGLLWWAGRGAQEGHGDHAQGHEAHEHGRAHE